MLGADGHAVQCADARAAPLEVGGPIDALAALYHPKLPARGACMLCTETGEIVKRRSILTPDWSAPSEADSVTASN